MRVHIKELTNACAKVTAMAGQERNIPGVLLHLKDGKLRVAYSDGRKAVFEDISVVPTDGDVTEPIAVNYARLISIVSACQPSGMIQIDEVDLGFTDRGIINVRAEKKVPIAGENEEEVNYRTCSVFQQSISFAPAEADRRTAILSRQDYDGIYNEEEYDIMNVADLASILNRLSFEPGKTVYVSNRNRCAFVAGTFCTSAIALPDSFSQTAIFTAAIAKAIVDILNKVGNAEEICFNVSKNGDFIKLFTEDHRVGIWCEAVKGAQMHLATFKTYSERPYKNYQITMLKEVLHNAIKSAMAEDKSESTTFSFSDNEDFGMKQLNLSAVSSTGSVSNDYSVILEKCYDPTNTLNNFKVSIGMKVLDTILQNCKEDFVGFDVEVLGNGDSYLRISDIDIVVKKSIEFDMLAEKGLAQGSALEPDDEALTREKAMTARYYCAAAKR